MSHDMVYYDMLRYGQVNAPAIGSVAVEKAYTWIRGKLPAVNNGPGLATAPGPGLGSLDDRLARPMNTSKKSVAF